MRGDAGTGATRRVAETVEGTHRGHFAFLDWGQLAINSLIFGSAFLWISVALRSVAPGLLAFGRVALGAAALALVARARVRIARQDRMRTVAAGFFGSAGPALLFALAEQRVSSALAGMLVSGVPILTAALAGVISRERPSRLRLVGLAIGAAGIVMLAVPDLRGAEAEPLGVALVLLAVAFYAVSGMLYAPLRHAYGALPVTMWTLLAAAAILAPFGVAGLADSRFEWGPVGALVLLGVLGTGVVWALHLDLLGRVGAVRAAVVGYSIPLVALALGVIVLDEHVVAIQVIGVVVALIGGWLVSRGRSGGH